MGSPGEQVLVGGKVADRVVRVGATVRKPATPATPAVEALLELLTAVGFSGAPRTLGRDKLGRHVLEFVPGQLADTLPPASSNDLRRDGRLIREFHDAPTAHTGSCHCAPAAIRPSTGRDFVP